MFLPKAPLPPIEKVERALLRQLAGGLVLDSLPPFVGGLDIASNVLIPANSYRGRKVEIELVVDDLQTVGSPSTLTPFAVPNAQNPPYSGRYLAGSFKKRSL